VQPFKCGPDYIDPAFHEIAAGRPSFNLDSWAMGENLIATLATEASSGATISIAEGVMGLFDGAAAPGQSGTGATADLAALLGWPVVLVLDVAGQTETAAAVALGCARYRDDVGIAGVILNRVASQRHFSLVAPAFERIKMRIFGAILRDERLALPERHLGLVQAAEIPAIDQRLDALADIVGAAIDLDAIVQSATSRSAKANPTEFDPDCRRLDSASRLRRTGHFPSCIRMSSGNGGARARKSFRSRRWPTSLPMPQRMPSGCRAVIPSSMPARWLPLNASEQGSSSWPDAPLPSMVSVVAIWCSDAGSRMPMGTGTK
jgi:cobyrinic acid a,c-diamide synthase